MKKHYEEFLDTRNRPKIASMYRERSYDHLKTAVYSSSACVCVCLCICCSHSAWMECKEQQGWEGDVPPVEGLSFSDEVSRLLSQVECYSGKKKRFSCRRETILNMYFSSLTTPRSIRVFYDCLKHIYIYICIHGIVDVPRPSRGALPSQVVEQRPRRRLFCPSCF